MVFARGAAPPRPETAGAAMLDAMHGCHAHGPHTLRSNRQAFDDYRLLTRVLVDVAQVDTTTALLGAPSALPLAN